MILKEIQDVLERVLLQDGEMDRALYEWEMEEHVDYWTASMRRDRDEYLFVVDVHMNNVTRQPGAALLVLEPMGPISVNEAARDRLKALWKDAYVPNMQKLIPSFAKQLKKGELAVNGVKTALGPISRAKTKRSMGRH
jgi:hypothetical protein